MQDSCLAPGLISYQQALDKVMGLVKVVDECETLPLTQSLGRVLANDVNSAMNVPPADNSAMDGYAFCHKDAADGKPLNLIGRAMAGQPFTGQLSQGQCCRIMTGAVVPAGADTVVMQENTEVNDNLVQITQLPKPGACIRRAGEDVAKGATVLKAGSVIGAADIGVMASLGITDVEVKRKIKVALIASGDELKKPGEPLAAGEIYETNATTIASMLARMPVEVLDLGIIADDKQALAAAFNKADCEADVVISSGGVSVGDADYTKDVLAELGKVDFWKVAIKPGKPFACGTLPNSVFFGLPGNPVSALVTFWQLAVPALKTLAGQTDCLHARLKVKAKTPLRKAVGRMDFQRGVLEHDANGELRVNSTGAQGSGMLSSVLAANCFIQLEAERGSVEQGEWVWVQPFDAMLK